MPKKHTVICSPRICSCILFSRNSMSMRQAEILKWRRWEEGQEESDSACSYERGSMCMWQVMWMVSPSRLPVNTIRSPPFERKCLWPFPLLCLNLWCQPKGNPYMVMRAGTARWDVNVTMWGNLQFKEGFWNSQQLFPGCRDWSEVWMTFNLVETGEQRM